MPELPWVKWYPTNWASEPGLRLCHAATRGIWFEALNTMMLQGAYKVTGTKDQLCCLLGCKLDEISTAIVQLKVFKVADVCEQNGNISLVSRRLKRLVSISEVRRMAGKASGKARTKPEQTPNRVREQTHEQTSAYACASTSAYASKGNGEAENADGIFGRFVSEISRLFKRPKNQVWSYEEQSYVGQIIKSPSLEEEVQLVRKWFEGTKPEDIQYLPHTVSRLLEDWGGTLDKARKAISVADNKRRSVI